MFKPRVRRLDRENENSRSSKQNAEQNEAMARRLAELENEVQNLRADAQRQASWLPNKSSTRPVRPSVQDSTSTMTSSSTRDESTAHSTHENKCSYWQGKTSCPAKYPRNCFNCGEIGHFSRDCRKPKYFGNSESRGTQVPRTENNTTREKVTKFRELLWEL